MAKALGKTQTSAPAKGGQFTPLPIGSEPSRARWVYSSLRNAIHQGHLARGERMREEEIAQSLGVSRTPVREALALLQAAGLVEAKAGGLVVTTLTRGQVIELYAMREILEGSAAGLAALHASATEIATLRHLCQVFAQSIGNVDRLAQVNHEIHNTIYEAAHNRYLLRTLHELHDSLALLTSTTFSVEGRGERAVKEHKDIVDAIEKRDGERAERAARAHIRAAQEARLAMMFEFR
jgi:DNA-binding GntR family transcriptional regulator